MTTAPYLELVDMIEIFYISNAANPHLVAANNDEGHGGDEGHETICHSHLREVSYD
jgi:hypothetical protein